VYALALRLAFSPAFPLGLPHINARHSPRERAAHDVVELDHIQTVPRVKIGALITKLTPGRMDQTRTALSFALGFPLHA